MEFLVDPDNTKTRAGLPHCKWLPCICYGSSFCIIHGQE
jgi:hypothetical protein